MYEQVKLSIDGKKKNWKKMLMTDHLQCYNVKKKSFRSNFRFKKKILRYSSLNWFALFFNQQFDKNGKGLKAFNIVNSIELHIIY